ncbi:uncharacterized protein LOC122706926 [Cervus elaphus]|uniref:uncharacterized protein LOC122706926 n=1 Tax=Cervus elaphus TaxID=9860 RepID=UPI001CC29B60|nr:uncharacterized protein LOC122706926 [Cervus elaphus]
MSVRTEARKKGTVDLGARGSVTWARRPGTVSVSPLWAQPQARSRLSGACVGKGPRGGRRSLPDDVGALFPAFSLPGFSWLSSAPTWYLHLVPPGMGCPLAQRVGRSPHRKAQGTVGDLNTQGPCWAALGAFDGCLPPGAAPQSPLMNHAEGTQAPAGRRTAPCLPHSGSWGRPLHPPAPPPFEGPRLLSRGPVLPHTDWPSHGPWGGPCGPRGDKLEASDHALSHQIAGLLCAG